MSSTGYVLMELSADAHEALEATARRERWRSSEPYRPPGSLSGISASSPTTLGDELCAARGIDEASDGQSHPAPVPRRLRLPRVDGKVAGVVPRLPEMWAFTPRWSLVVAGFGATKSTSLSSRAARA